MSREGRSKWAPALILPTVSVPVAGARRTEAVARLLGTIAVPNTRRDRATVDPAAAPGPGPGVEHPPPAALTEPRSIMKALLIPARGKTSVIELSEDHPDGSSPFLTELRDRIGVRNVHQIRLTRRWSAWLDKHAATNKEPVNLKATTLARIYRASGTHALHGTVILTGTDATLGLAIDLTAEQIVVILQRITDTPSC